jgi:hypothetical protein
MGIGLSGERGWTEDIRYKTEDSRLKNFELSPIAIGVEL